LVSELCNDLNTPNALAVVFALEQMAVRGGRTTVGNGTATTYPPDSVLKATANLMGLLVQRASEREMQLRVARGIDSSRVASLVVARAASRKAKNFPEADRIRDELDSMGIQLRDSKDPKTGELVTTWEVKR
jgi:cysteinyl-tRNA synthetase